MYLFIDWWHCQHHQGQGTCSDLLCCSIPVCVHMTVYCTYCTVYIPEAVCWDMELGPLLFLPHLFLPSRLCQRKMTICTVVTYCKKIVINNTYSYLYTLYIFINTYFSKLHVIINMYIYFVYMYSIYFWKYYLWKVVGGRSEAGSLPKVIVAWLHFKRAGHTDF